MLASEAARAGDLAGARREQERLAGLRPSMAAIEGALALFADRLEALASSDPWAQAVDRALEETLGRLDAARSGVVASARCLLDRHDVDRVVTISCSSTVRAILEDWPVVDVLVGEGRPGLEGRTLAGGFAAAGRRVTLCTDASLPALLDEGDLILSGADAVEADGTLINKVGTLALALAARHLAIPVYAACERFKFVGRTGLVLEEQEGAEVWQGAPDGIEVRNPYFERTPAALVTGFVTDEGVLAWDGERWVDSPGRRC
jgi:translation initiation factor 2B subunit (eIF-2B alpha/beta/delta family)